MKLLRRLIFENDYEFIDEEAEDEWYDIDPDVAKAGSLAYGLSPAEIEGEYPDFPGLKMLGEVTMLTGYRAGGAGSVLYKDKNNSVYEVDTLSGDGSEHVARLSGHKVKDLGKYFL